jgi:signal peptidase I
VGEDSNERIRVFYPRQTCFIYKYTLMGLRGDKVQITSVGFYILPRANDKEAIGYQEQRYV